MSGGPFHPWDGLIAGADFLLDERAAMIPCRTCGAREPVSLFTVGGVSRCSECCPDHPKRWCSVCRRRLLPEDGETCGPCLGGPPERLVSRGGVIVKERAPVECAVCHRTLTPEEDDAAITVNLGLRTGSMCARCTDRHYSPPEDLES